MLSYVPSSRRRFLKRFALGSLAFPVAGAMRHGFFLADLEAAAIPNAGAVKISLSEFPSLQDPFGSLRLGMNPVGPDHFPEGAVYPLLITRGIGDAFYALSAECRHESCVVDTYDDFAQGLECPCHHSLYAIDGTVIRGPASKNLKPYASHYDGKDLLTVQVPGVAFAVTPRRQTSAGSNRLRLEFMAEADVVYELQFRANLADAWTSVPFATASDGAMDQTSWSGPEGTAMFYVDRSAARGFYSIVMDWMEV
ncbi:MAG: Rieske 2Fe-2S domain-containing protein [Verrucomicrobia bacterium]|nr:Rieske 2Fe-2S domain-containing protein [Verrucomicrobiota bacterium]MBI3867214.1 Rieske 2Fe-2S domain-containing protein [Verrucomicrobiota bacterium]